MNSPITEIPLADQIIAILRCYRLQSATAMHDSTELAVALGRPAGEIVASMARLYEQGFLLKMSIRGRYSYRIGSDYARSPGFCVCCDEKAFSDSRLFCESCAPHFDGRI